MLHPWCYLLAPKSSSHPSQANNPTIQQQTWGYHAMVGGWYITPTLKHYWCIKIITAHTGGELINDTFKFKHHVLLVPYITQSDFILDATAQLLSALTGVQTAPPDKLEAITSIHCILLGELQQPPNTTTDKPTIPQNSQCCQCCMHWQPQTSPPSCQILTLYHNPAFQNFTAQHQ